MTTSPVVASIGRERGNTLNGIVNGRYSKQVRYSEDRCCSEVRVD